MEIKPDHIIARVLSGNASSEDILALSDWLNADEKNKEEFRLLKNYWDAEVTFCYPVNQELSLQKLLNKINEPRRRQNNKRYRLIFISAAASIALLILSGLYFFSRQQSSESTHLYTYLTDDSKSNITLDDGTIVTLNKNSKLTYSNRYGKGARSVQLEGEAYFEVTKDSVNPFEIEMNGASIKVLGTVFSVNADPQSNIIRATLVEGSVNFKSKAQQVTLKPDQQLIFYRSNNEIEIHSVNAYEETAWKDGLFKYKSVIFTKLIDDLEKNYNVKIFIKNKDLLDPSITVSGSFSEDQSIEEILQVVSRSLPIQWSKINGIYYIK